MWKNRPLEQRVSRSPSKKLVFIVDTSVLMTDNKADFEKKPVDEHNLEIVKFIT